MPNKEDVLVDKIQKDTTEYRKLPVTPKPAAVQQHSHTSKQALFKPKTQAMTLLFSLPGGAEWIIIFFCLMLLIPVIFYLATLQSTFNVISVENRKMPSGNVWLLLIPLFGIYWHFIIVNKLADSIKAEAFSKNIIVNESGSAYNTGLAMCILNCLFFIPSLGSFTNLAGLVCWIIYWVKITSCKNALLAGNYNSFE